MILDSQFNAGGPQTTGPSYHMNAPVCTGRQPEQPFFSAAAPVPQRLVLRCCDRQGLGNTARPPRHCCSPPALRTSPNRGDLVWTLQFPRGPPALLQPGLCGSLLARRCGRFPTTRVRGDTGQPALLTSLERKPLRCMSKCDAASSFQQTSFGRLKEAPF